MIGNAWVRPVHRWGSMAFTATVAVDFAGLALGEPPAWLYLLPLPPLALLLLTGLVLFARPYVSKGSLGRGNAQGAGLQAR